MAEEDIPDFFGLTCASYEWEQFYQSMVVEELPYDMPVAKGKPVRVSGYFDANHAGCLQTRRSVMGIVMFLNKTPVKWYSKQQNTIETSTYGSELVAARIATEFAIELRYKLRMLGWSTYVGWDSYSDEGAGTECSLQSCGWSYGTTEGYRKGSGQWV